MRIEYVEHPASESRPAFRVLRIADGHWAVRIFDPRFGVEVDIRDSGWRYTACGKVTVGWYPGSGYIEVGYAEVHIEISASEASLLEDVLTGAKPMALGEVIDTEQEVANAA